MQLPNLRELLTEAQLCNLITTSALDPVCAAALTDRMLTHPSTQLLSGHLITLGLQYNLILQQIPLWDKMRLINSIKALPYHLTGQLLSNSAITSALAARFNNAEKAAFVAMLNINRQLLLLETEQQFCRVILQNLDPHSMDVYTDLISKKIIAHGCVPELLVDLGANLNAWLATMSLDIVRSILLTPQAHPHLIQLLTVEQLSHWVETCQTKINLPQKDDFKPLVHALLNSQHYLASTPIKLLDFICITQAMSELWNNDPVCNHLFSHISMRQISDFADFCFAHNKSELKDDKLDVALFSRKIALSLINVIDSAKASLVPLTLFNLIVTSNYLSLFLNKLGAQADDYFTALPPATLGPLLKNKDHHACLTAALEPSVVNRLVRKGNPSVMGALSTLFYSKPIQSENVTKAIPPTIAPTK